MTALPEKRRLRISGGELAYVDAGSPEDPALLLLHGFPTSSYLWRELVPMCSPWMRVIAPDLLGTGDSEKPGEGVDLSLRAQLGYVRELLDALGVGELAVAGHGFGGGIAQLLALAEPERVRTMVLLDAIAFDGWPSEAIREIQRQSAGPARPEVVAAVARTAFDLGMGRRARLSDEDLAEYLRPFSDQQGASSFVRLAQAMDGLGLIGIEGDLERLELPVLVVWGEDDPFFPVTLGERLNDVMPTSSLAVLPGCAHFVTEDSPETVLPLVKDYLRARYLQLSHAHGEPGAPVLVQLERPAPDPSEWELDDG